MRYKWLWLLQMMMITLGGALLLMVISKLEGNQPRWSAMHPVFAEQKPIQLNDDNLVDELILLKLPLRLSKVELNGAILTVDLKVTEELNKAEMYQAMAEIISFSFERTTNIDQLLLRLVAEDRWVGNKYLLLAADVRRGAWPISALSELRNTGNEELTEEIKGSFRVTESPLWKRRFESNDAELEGDHSEG